MKQLAAAAAAAALTGVLFWTPAGAKAGPDQPDEPIDINTATAEELTELPRVGPVLAKRIVAWREENGPFSSVEELLNVEGVGERTFEMLKPHVKVGDPPDGGTTHPEDRFFPAGQARRAA